MERAFYFENDMKRLFAFLHSPDDGRGNGGIIFCHPYGEEKQLSYRVFVRFARELCLRGFHVLRFDCYGYGDSEGNFEEATLETQIADTIKAIDLLEVQFGIRKVSLLGLRWGGTVAALAAEQDSRIESLILWSPIINGKEYLDELIRKEMLSNLVNKVARVSKDLIFEEFKSKGLINIEGHNLTMGSFEEISGIDLTALASRFKGTAFMAATKDIPRVHQSLETLSEIYKKNGVFCELNLVDDRIFWDWESFWVWYMPEQLYEVTLNWIGKNLKER
jgi:exosortase A-associated hydrolase 2